MLRGASPALWVGGILTVAQSPLMRASRAGRESTASLPERKARTPALHARKGSGLSHLVNRATPAMTAPKEHTLPLRGKHRNLPAWSAQKEGTTMPKARRQKETA